MSHFLNINIEEKYSRYHLKLKFACERPLSPLQPRTDFLLGSIIHMICPLLESLDMNIKENVYAMKLDASKFSLTLIDFLSRGNLEKR